MAWTGARHRARRAPTLGVIAQSIQGARPEVEASAARSAPAPWRRADLLGRVHQALGTARRALDAALEQEEPSGQLFDPNQAKPSQGRPLSLPKVVAEAAMLMRCAAFLRLSDDSIGEAIDSLASRLAPHARSEMTLAHLCREPARAIEHAAGHVYLTVIGHADEAFDRFLIEMLRDESIGSSERQPNHALECHWLVQIHSGEVKKASIDATLLANTCIALPLDALGSSTLDLYAFTHVILYASDMGRRPAPWPRPVDEIAADAEAALAAALDADNFDLAAELLWTWPMLGLAWSPAANFAFRVLASAADEHGFLPGPEYSELMPEGGARAQPDRHVLRTSYHANVVMGLLCAVALRPGRAPSWRLAETAPDEAKVDRLLRLMRPASRKPRWLGIFAALKPAHRAAIAPLVSSIVLRRLAAADDLQGLRAALQEALSSGWAEGPAVRQSVALLRRATALARLRPASVSSPQLAPTANPPSPPPPQESSSRQSLPDAWS